MENKKVEKHVLKRAVERHPKTQRDDELEARAKTVVRGCGRCTSLPLHNFRVRGC
jgi:hypothetical protein